MPTTIVKEPFLERIAQWGKNRLMMKRMAYGLSIAAIISAIVTYISISGSGSPFGPNPNFVVVILTVNLALLLTLVAIVVRRAIGLWLEFKQGSAGSKLQTRIVAAFSIVTIFPTVIISIFSALFFNFGIQSWFDQRVSTALEESVAVAEAYLDEHKAIIRADALAMANDLNQTINIIISNPLQFNKIVDGQVILRSLTEAVVFQRNRVVAQSRLSFSLMFETLAADVLELADSGEVIIMTDEEENKIRALVKLDDIEDTYLLIGRLVDSKVIDHMENAQSAVNEYRRLSDQISGIQIQFSVVFLLVALLLLLVAIWYGMYFAQRLVIPLSRLIGASERIRGGDFTARVETRADDDEIARLGRSFNRMTERLESQRGELIDINRQMDERRRFSEAVLEGVSAGVIALDEQKHISLVNKSADQLLHDLQLNEHWGKELTKLIPEITSLLEDAERKPERGAQGQVILKIKSSVLILHVRVTIEAFDGKIEGYIVTLDDLSELSAAQRTAAWSDVARRIAHEIKNPLTPIQLSAERLKRKYGEQIDSDREAFDRYIDTISRHVTDIGHMVEEFVSFARMPKPVFKQKDIVSIIRKAVFSERTSHPEITYSFETSEEAKQIRCDEHQISQMLANILKNAAESIESRLVKEGKKGKKGMINIALSSQDQELILSVSDNGTGVDPEQLPHIMEPYVTSRGRGTGLGLAIVKKTMEDHKGSITITNQPDGGACVTLIFSEEHK